MTDGFKILLIWVLGAATALLVALAPFAAVMVDGHYIPDGPDSFYHARRILDAVADPAAFFQFDRLMHVPEGSLVTWPWAYDWTMSLLVRLGMALHLAHEPITILDHIPVVAFIFAPTLMMVICRQLGVGLFATLLATVATSFFPLNQNLYGIGNIDHHYVEHLFVLGSLAGGLAWLRQPQSNVRAAVAGLVLGFAPGVHTAEFILQVPLLCTFGWLWIRNSPRPRNTHVFAAALVGATVAIALPSLPLQLGRFETYTLSWFQVYCALCTACLSIFLCRTSVSKRNVAWLIAITVAMLIPAGGQMLFATRFLTSDVSGMTDISEVRSPWQMLHDFGGIVITGGYYTYLLLLVPATISLCLWRTWRESEPQRILFWIAAAFGLVLLLQQMRMEYFGSFALYLPWILWVDERTRAAAANIRVAAMAALCAVLAFAYSPGVLHRLFQPTVLAGDPFYQATRKIYTSLAEECRHAPGTTLANPFDGHYVRYHTDCSVIANPFFVTPQHERKLAENVRLMNLPAAQLAANAPYVRYVFVRRNTLFYQASDGTIQLMPKGVPGTHDLPLVDELLSTQPDALPPHFRLLKELYFPGFETWPYARLFAVDPS